MTDRSAVAMCRSASRFRPALIALVLCVLAVVLPWARPAAAAEATFYVAPNGSDAGAGTVDAPFATVGRGVKALAPGDRLFVRGGTYAERIMTPAIASGRADAPIRVQAFPGERPVIAGLFWLRNANYWTIDGINVTWGDGNASNEHMVKMIDGIGWSIVNSEIWGARSYAAVLVAGTTVGQPADWRISGNCIHDTHPSNSTNQDHLIYANTGVTAGPGVIERNVLFNATNGTGLKLGGASATSGGGANVTMRSNTVYNTTQNVIVSWQSHDNVITNNLFSKVGTNYGNVRGYQLTGTSNTAVGNVGGGAKSFLLNDGGYLGVADAGNTFPVDPQFDDVTSCNGFRPQNRAAATAGRFAGSGDVISATSSTATTAPVPLTTVTASDPVPAPELVSRPVKDRKGYRLVASDGGMFAFGDAGYFGSTGDIRLNHPIVGAASTPSGAGYWLVASDGGIFSFGDAEFFGSTGAMRLNKPILGMAATPTGRGYWLTASDGGIFAFGDAAFHGSTGAITLNKPIAAMSTTPSGNGYWLTASDGGIFAFGDATYHGSTADLRLPGEIVGMATAESGTGYWLAGADGSVYSFGSAPHLGSAAGGISSPVTDIARGGSGFWLATTDGSIHSFGGAPAVGSMSGTRLALPVVGMVAIP